MKLKDKSIALSLTTTGLTGRCQNCLVFWPSKDQPVMDRGVWYACLFAPLGNCLYQSVRFYFAIAASVVRLLCWTGPSAVFRRVAQIIVYPINRQVLAIGWSHVLQKCHEGVTPAVTDSDATPAVVLVAVVLWICASPNHALINLVKPGVTVSMCAATGTCALALETATALRCSAHKMDLPDKQYLSASAAAQPHSGFCATRCNVIVSLTEDNKSSKCLSGQIDLVPVRTFRYIAVRHAFSPIRKTVLEQPFGPSTQRLFAFYPESERDARENPPSDGLAGVANRRFKYKGESK